MTTETAAMAQALTELADAPLEVRGLVGAQLLYALGLLERPGPDTEEATS